ncbi:uncharacterized protein K460DRAFT_403759 [Cucurbitaria berberidis CBS 394.84]|uniref:Uncharacterized protein n=1 Tax=Cucurbitaria berberidis CBS 394.84 TaxID=1168544 RepID=A0A9P4GLE5_9PLEO|nr:uncharacterized protein K460DRAFT_403759 [Cucurbitaria berberidis CBS 394.84]KAF1848478.1 hypothetical protein K460DRAFT_403759 [Cucurbitaria berberidis CBS 394.84]
MAGGPPLGQPWLANVGNNPNINREPPPPPLNAIPGAQAPPPPGAGGQHQVVVEQHQAPVYGPPVPIGIGGPPIGFGAPPFGVGLGIGAFPPFVPPIGVGMMDPFMFGGYYGGGGGPLAPIRAGNFLPGAHSGIGFGLHAAGVPFPPPPPGTIAGVVPPFAPAAPLWAPGGGLAFGNVPAMGVGGVYAGGMMAPMMGVGGMGAAAPMHARPAPMVIDGNMGFPAQPEQQEITQIAGGIPPGVALIEPNEHTIIIQIKGNVCPWLSPGAQFQVEPLAMASTTGLNRLIQICSNGASPEDCENMAVTECIELGNGLWEKGQTFKFNDAVSRVLTMKDAGWDNTRNRTNGNSLHLWAHQL